MGLIDKAKKLLGWWEPVSQHRSPVSNVRLPVMDYDDEPQGLDAVIGGGERDSQTIYRDGRWTDTILPRRR